MLLTPMAGSAVMVQGGERNSRSMLSIMAGMAWKPTSEIRLSGLAAWRSVTGNVTVGFIVPAQGSSCAHSGMTRSLSICTGSPSASGIDKRAEVKEGAVQL